MTDSFGVNYALTFNDLARIFDDLGSASQETESLECNPKAHQAPGSCVVSKSSRVGDGIPAGGVTGSILAHHR
jgi:hypothetical protein